MVTRMQHTDSSGEMPAMIHQRDTDDLPDNVPAVSVWRDGDLHVLLRPDLPPDLRRAILAEARVYAASRAASARQPAQARA